MARPLEICCTACGRNALARAEPLYEGFQKRGEAFVCTACGHRYPSREATPFADRAVAPRVFTDADPPETVRVFKESERRRCCAWCAHFVVNPFGQRCGLTNRETEATGLCDRFESRAEPAVQPQTPPKPRDPLAGLFGDGTLNT
ncbi:MAG: hypothetical protein PHR35_03530 [Kiritimatiellae bacterium]|nr:hypothetical protein [Kiritimatiellia bacterium]